MSGAGLNRACWQVASRLPGLGTEHRSLVIFPGLADAAWDVTSRKWNLLSQYRRLADEFTVTVISRKRGSASWLHDAGHGGGLRQGVRV